MEYRLLRPTEALVYIPGTKKGSIVNATARAGFALRSDHSRSGTVSASEVANTAR